MTHTGYVFGDQPRLSLATTTDYPFEFLFTHGVSQPLRHRNILMSKAVYALMKASRSALTSSFWVVHMPCGAPL